MMIEQLLKKEELHVLTDALLTTLDVSPDELLRDGNTWHFLAVLENVKREKILPFVMNHSSLMLQHDLLRAESLMNAERCDAKERAKRIISALVHAELLEHIYIKYLKTSGNALDSIRRAQFFYRSYLQKIGLVMPLPESTGSDDELLYDNLALRETTQKLDFWRLMFTRGRRMLMFSIVAINNFEYYGRWLLLLDQVLSVVAIYSSFLLLPRLLSNIAYVSEHLQDASQIDSKLSPLERHICQMDMRSRWWEIAYDTGWVLNGILAAFVLVGSLLPFAIYLTIASPTLNLCLHTSRLIIEQVRFNTLLESYEALLENTDSQAQKVELQNLIHALKEKNGGAIVGAAAGAGVSLVMVTTSLSIMLLAGTNPLGILLLAALAVIATLAGKIIRDNFPEPSSALNDDNFKVLEFGAISSPHVQNSMFSSRVDSSQDSVANAITPDIVTSESSCSR